MPANPRDRELASRLVAGDEQALRETYRTHAPAVHGLALRVLSNEALAEEIVQEVFVRLWEHPERYDMSRGPLRAFLLSMTHSRAVERVRSEESLRRRHAKLERQPTQPGEDPARVVETHESEEALRAALAALPAQQRRPIEMAYFDGLSYREVARELGEPEGTVKYRIRMGMQQLRAALRAGGRAVTDAWDDEDRAIARALGVEPPDDGGRADEGAVADYEAVVAALPFEEVAPAADLEDRVVAAALARRPAAVRSIDTTRSAGEPERGRSARRWLAAGAAAVAAAAIVVVLIAGRTPSGSGASGGRVEPAAANGGVAKVLADPATRQGVLRSPTGVAGGRVLLDPGGSGYLTGLPIPAGATTYWLWLDTASPVRVGSIPDASTVHFVVHGDVGAVRGVIITTDPGAPAPFSWRALLSN